jgi:hypothetical protein
LRCSLRPRPAELTRGHISGTVSDPSGATVANVKITATNRARQLDEFLTTGISVRRSP